MATINDPFTYMSDYWQGSIDDDILIYSGGDDFINGRGGHDKLIISSLVLNHIEKIFFRDGKVSTDNLTYKSVDSINPSLSSSTPADNATALATTSNIVLIFKGSVFKSYDDGSAWFNVSICWSR